MKGTFRDLIPVETKVGIQIPANKKVTGVHLLMIGVRPIFENKDGMIILTALKVLGHEIVALDMA